MKYKIRVIVVLLVVLFASLARSSPAFAQCTAHVDTNTNIYHSCIACEDSNFCATQFSAGSGAICADDKTCWVYNLYKASNSLRDFQETNAKARASGEWPLERWLGGNKEQSSMTIIGNNLAFSLIGPDIDLNKAMAGDFQHVQIGGLLGASSNLLASIITQPPVSSYEYFADLGRNLGLPMPKTAYAQGIGFTGLSNLLPLWKAARNLSYFLFVIIFIAMGLAIMFRVKLDPKTVISIQNALPKLVIALILVTFSYAIAGLMIDLIYLLIYLVILALKGVPGMPAEDISVTQAQYVNLGFFKVAEIIFGNLGEGVIRSAAGLLGGAAPLLLITVIIGLVAQPVITGGAIGLIVLIFGIITLFLVIKLFFSLISCYIAIIISVITAPLQIMMGVLPGSSGGFSTWFSNLMANILVFPAVALALLLSSVLVKTTGPKWAPPVIAASGGALTGILGLGMLLLINKIPDMVKEMFKIKPGKLGTAIGEAVGAPKRLVGSAIGLGTTAAGINKSFGEITGDTRSVFGRLGVGKPKGGKLPSAEEEANMEQEALDNARG